MLCERKGMLSHRVVKRDPERNWDQNEAMIDVLYWTEHKIIAQVDDATMKNSQQRLMQNEKKDRRRLQTNKFQIQLRGARLKPKSEIIAK